MYARMKQVAEKNYNKRLLMVNYTESLTLPNITDDALNTWIYNSSLEIISSISSVLWLSRIKTFF